MFEGSMVALITPFKKGRIDEKALKNLVAFHVGKSDGIVPCGTTGESPTLSPEEHERVIEIVVKAAAGRIPVIAGTGSNSTEEALALTRHAKKVGADAVLMAMPYYNRPSQQGLYLHFQKIARAVDIPIILYNIPSRTGVNMEPETVLALTKLKNIVGTKEASGNLDQMGKIISLCPPQFDVISGDDSLTLPLMALGGKGIISVVANIVPEQMSQMVHLFRQGRVEQARALHYHLLTLMKAMTLEINPVPVKTAAAMMGLCCEGVRLPLAPLSSENKAQLRSVLKSFKLI